MDPEEARRHLLALEWFERLCDRSDGELDALLEAVPEEVAEQVLGMLRADRTTDDLRASAVQWAMAEQLVAPEPEPTAIPEQLGPFVRGEPLGEGGMGRVFVAEQASPRRRVALKVIRGEGAEARQQALDEAQALADVADPCIPHVLEVGEEQGVAWIAMELVDGVRLDQWAAARPLVERVRAVEAIARGVAAVHGVGVVHSDLKPANVLVEASGTPRIVDFGLAAHRDGGTLAYLSPERLEGGPASVAGDVFALGVTLYEVVCGQRPYPQASRPSRSAEQRGRGRRVPVPSALGCGDADLDAVVLRALAPEAQRYPDAGALADDLRRWLGHEPVVARPQGPWRRLRLWERRNRRSLRLVLTTGLCVGLGIVALVGLERAQRRAASQAREARAAERLEALVPALATRVEGGQLEQAEAMVQAFTAEPEVRDTEGASRAWLRLHELQLQTGARRSARESLARAYLAARPGRLDPVRRAVARVLWADASWGPLLHAVTGDEAPSMQRARAEALLANRHVQAGAELLPEPLRPVARALGAAERTPYRPIWVGSHEQRWLVALQDDQRVVAVQRRLGLPEVQRWPWPDARAGFGNPMWLGGETPALVGHPVAGGGLTAWQLTDDGELRTVDLGHDGRSPIGDVAVADTDGDGRQEVYVGELYPDRHLFRVDAGGEQPATKVPLGRAAAGADQERLLPVDLDGDGDDELLVSAGLWSGLDLRVLDHRDGALEVVQRLRFLGTPQPVVVHGGDGRRWLAVSVAGHDDPESVLGSARFGRLPSGLHLFGIDGGRLVPHAHLSLQPDAFQASRVFAADLDGDGDQEVVAHVSIDTSHTWIVRVDPDAPDGSRLDGFLVERAEPLAVADLDDDGDDEVLLQLTDDDHHAWVVGAGEATLPTLGQPGERLDGRQPVQELLRMGFEREAAAALRAQAETATADRRAGLDLATAARLLAHQDHPRDAMTLYEEALRRLPDRADWAAERDRLARRVHLDAAPDWSGRGPAVFAALEAVRPELLDLDGEGLWVDALGGDGVVVRMPLAATEEGRQGAFGIEVDLLVEELDPGASLKVELVAADGSVVQALEVAATGGNLRAERFTRCHPEAAGAFYPSYTNELAQDLPPSRHLLRTHRRPDELVCDAARNGRTEELRHRVPLLSDPPVPVMARLRVDSEEHLDGTRVRARVDAIRIWGLRPSASPGGPSWARRWVQGDLEQALSQSEPGLARMLLAVELGEHERALALLQPMDLDDANVHDALVRGLRLAPGTWIPLVRQRAPERFGALYAEAWTHTLSAVRSDSVRATAAHPFVDEVPIDGPTVWRLLWQRALLWLELEQPVRARRVLKRLLPGAEERNLPLVHLELARLAARAGDAEGARDHCDAARAHDAGLRIGDTLRHDPVLAAPCGE